MRIGEFLADIGRPVAYYPQLARAVGSVNAAIMLCQLLYWDGKQHDSDGWVVKTSAELEAETGLSRREQDTARRLLRTLGIVEERLAGLPAKLQYRVAHDVLDRVWEAYRQTCLAESADQVWRKAPNCDGGKRQTIYRTETTTETTTENKSVVSTPAAPNHDAAADAEFPAQENSGRRQPVPIDKIVGLYHEVLPMCPQVRRLTQVRRRQIEARWRDGDMPDLDTWRSYFAFCSRSKFLTGAGPSMNGRPPFMADLEWLTKEANYTKIFEGKYHR